MQLFLVNLKLLKVTTHNRFILTIFFPFTFSHFSREIKVEQVLEFLRRL